MSKVAVMVTSGYEESETMIIVDFLRRLQIEATTFSLTDNLYVTGMQKITCKCDVLFNEAVDDYDMVFLPGGRPGGANLSADERVIKLIQRFNEQGKYVAAMCSGTTVLEQASIINGRKVTGYHGYEDKLLSGIFVKEVVVADENLITSIGPATPFPMVYKMAEVLGVDPSDVKEKTLYNFAKGK